MNSTKSIANFLVLGAAALLFAACANQMEPAKHALDDINSAVNAASADAQKYIPDQLTSVQKELADLKASYDKKDYAAVLTHAPAVLADAKNLAADATAKKDEAAKAKALEAEWSGFAATLPQLISVVKNRIDALSRTRRVPKGIDLAVARSGLADATAEWENAQSAYASGKAEDAVAAAKDVKSKTEAAASSLKLELPGTDK